MKEERKKGKEKRGEGRIEKEGKSNILIGVNNQL